MQYTIKKQPITKENLQFMIAICKQNQWIDLQQVLEEQFTPKGFIQFDYHGVANNILCPFHNDHSMSGLESSSISALNGQGLMCWVCHKVINFYTLFNTKAVLRTSKITTHTENKIAMKSMNKFVNAMTSLNYNVWTKMLETLNRQDNESLSKYLDNVFNYYDITHTTNAKKYLALLAAISQNTINHPIINEYFKARGLSNTDFINQIQPFYCGKTVEEVQTVLTNLYNEHDELKQQFANNVLDYGKWLRRLELLKITKTTSSSILANRIGVKLMNNENEIVNFDLRSLDASVTPRYRFLSNKDEKNKEVDDVLNELQISDTNYLYNFNKHRNDLMLITEGIFDTLSLMYNGLYGVCAFSANLTDSQIALLESANSVKLSLSFDNDSAGLTNMITISKKLMAKGIWVNWTLVPSTYNNQPVKDWNEIQILHDAKITAYMQEHNTTFQDATSKLQNDLFQYDLTFDKNDALSIIQYLIHTKLAKDRCISYFYLILLIKLAQILVSKMSDKTILMNEKKFSYLPLIDLNKTANEALNDFVQTLNDLFVYDLDKYDLEVNTYILNLRKIIENLFKNQTEQSILLSWCDLNYINAAKLSSKINFMKEYLATLKFTEKQVNEQLRKLYVEKEELKTLNQYLDKKIAKN